MDYNRSLGSNLQPLAARGHRSVGAGSLDSLELSQIAGPRTRPNANAIAGGNANKENKSSTKGWNSSTRSSPAWKRNAGKENAENAAQRRPVASKKFQHVQCKLPAPLFQKRHSANMGAPSAASPRPALMVSSAAENKALPAYGDADNGFGKGLASLLDEDAHGPEGPVLAVPEAFITTRRGSLVPSPLMLDARDSDGPDVPSSRRSRRSSLPAELSTFYGDNDDTADFDEDEPECYGDNEVEAAPAPVRSPHPSVAALYHFTREVCTPASAHASHRPALSSTPTECADLVRRLEGALDEHTSESGGDELLGSFPSWLASMGLTTVSLSQDALDKMRTLWAKAKEAVQLQALVDNLKESELQLAQQEAAENERHVDLLLAENQDLAAAKRRLQEQLQEAEARLAQLSASHPSAPSPGLLACISSSTATAVSACDYAGRVPQNACASPGRVAPIAVSPGASAAVAGPDVLPSSPAAADTQTSSLSLGCDSPALGPHGPAPADSSTHSWGDASATGGSLTTISHLPQHVPFGAWAACILNPDTPASQGAVGVGPASLSSAAGSASQPTHNPTDAPTPSEAASLSVVSCTPARLPFDAWHAAGAAGLTPGAASDGVHSNAASLSMVSHTSQHVPFEAWYATGAAALADTPGFGSGAGSCAGECPEAPAAPSPEWSFSAEDQPEDAALGAMATPEHTTTSLSVLSRMPEALPFAAWAAAGAAEATTPTALPACGRSVNKPSAAREPDASPAGSPMLWSPTPWFNPDLARAYSPEPAAAETETPGASHASPQPSADLSMASEAPRPVAFAQWAQQEQQHEQQQDAVALSPASTVYGLSPLPQLDTPGDKSSPGPEILCNPLFDTNSAPPSLAATPLPERNDALPSMGSASCLESHSRGGVLLFSPACASAASPVAQGVPYTDEPVQAAQEQKASPDLLARFGSSECDASAAPSPAGSRGPTTNEPASTANPGPIAEEEQAVSAGAAVVERSPPHAFTRGPSVEPQSVEQEISSPPSLQQLQAVDSTGLGTPDAVRPDEESIAEASSAAVDPATPPGPAQPAPSAAMSEACSPTAVPASDAHADRSAPATPQDAAAPQEPATASPATPPPEAGLTETQPNELHASALHGHADESSQLVTSYPNTPQPDLSESPGSTIFATPLEAFPTPGSFLSLYTNARSGLATQNGQQGQLRSGVATPASFSFGMGALPFAMTPNQLTGSGVATPASFSFGMGGLPIGAVLASGSEAEDAPTPASFSFAPAGLLMAAAQLLGGAALGTPGTPALGMKLAPAPVPAPDSSSDSPAAAGTPVSSGAPPQGIIPCSPVPLVQLTPVHLRALDALAVHVMSELRPGLKMQQLQGSGSPISPPAIDRTQPQEQQQPAPSSPVGFSFMQLLAQLRSPMPQAAHRSLAAQHHTAAAPKPTAAPKAPSRSSSSQVQLLEQKAQQEHEAAPSGVSSADAMPMSSGLPDAPAFAQLLAFLHGAGPAAACGHGLTSGAPDQGPVPAAGTADREAPSPAAVHAFKHLLSHLCSPLPGGGAARVPQQPMRSPLVFGLPVLDEEASGSPGLLAGGMHDSPATSEAASFGFSTAAKQMTNRTPASNACNVSFVRWPQDAAPPTFGLGTDATGGVRGPRRMSPLGSPISFAFTGPGLAFRHAGADHVTPCMPGARAAGDAEGCPSAGPVVGMQSFGDRLQLAVSPTMPGSAVSACPSLALSFCHGLAGSPAFSLRGGAGASPSFSFGTAPSADAAAHCTTPSAAMGSAHAVQQPGDAQDVSGEPQADHSGAGVFPSLAGVSPAMSLGAWGAMAAYSGFYGSARRLTAASPGAASEFSFGFGAAPSHVGTPALAATCGSADGEGAADGAAASPEAAVPAVVAEAAAFWTSLLSNLCSPLPAGGLARLREGAPARQAVSPMQPMPSFAAGLADSGAQADAASSPVSGEGGTGSVSLAGSPSGVMATAVPDAQGNSAAVEEPAYEQQGTSGTGSASVCVPGSQQPEQQQDQLPPAYEALPELIAAGLCLSASTSLTMPSAQRACSSVGENPTPGGVRQLSSSVIDPGAALDDITMPLHTLLRGAGAAAAVGAQGDVETPGRLFNSRPTAMTPGAQASAIGGGRGAAAGSADSLVVESVSHSCSGSTASAAAGVAAGRTTEPVPTPSRLLRTAASACPPGAEADSVHESPVLSFGSAVPSAGQADGASAAGYAAGVPDAMPTPNSRDVSRPQSMGSGGAVGPSAATAGVTGSELADKLAAVQVGATHGADALAASAVQGLQQPGSNAPVPAASCSTGGDVAFSADAVQELLFAAGDAEPEASVEGTIGAAAAVVAQQEHQGDGEGHTRSAQSSPKSLDLAPSAAAAALRSVLATPDAKAAARSAARAAAAAAEQLPLGGAQTPTPSASSPAPSGRPSVYDGLPSPLSSSTPLSYPGTATLPTTPLSGARLGGSSPSTSNHFWAPTPAGPTGGFSAERVTLEVLNRRIRTNADMLLDFKGSPGRPNAVPSVTGTVRPGAQQPHAGSNAAAKAWSSSGAAAGPLQQQPTGHGASAAAPAAPAPAATTAAPRARRSRLPPPPNAAATAANRSITAPADTAAVAAGAAALGVAAAASIHMPLSQRLGLWPAGLAAASVPYGAPAAAWGVPYMWPMSRIPTAPGVAVPAVGVPVQPSSRAAAAGNGGVTVQEQEAGARTPSAGPVLPPRPAVESRDVQTTPGLARAAVTPSSAQRSAAGPSIRLQPPQRVPVRGGAAVASPTRPSKPPAPKPAPRAAVPLPEASAGSHAGGSQAGDSDDDSVLSLPVERVIRRRNSLNKPPGRVPVGGRSAAAGGGGGSGGGSGAAGGVALGEDEVRRRAQVLGMRISPYLRPKKK